MSNITSQQPIRWNIDTLNTRIQGVLTTKSGGELDFTRATSVSRFTPEYSQPGGTYIYLAFQVNNTWGAINNSGGFTAFRNQTITYDNVAANGNTVASLTALTSIPALAGNRVGVAIALAATDPDNALPSIRVKFTCLNDSQQLTATELSPVYELGSNSQIVRLNATSETSDGGSVNVLAQITDQTGNLSGWKALEYFTGAKASRIQFKGEYKAQTVGKSSASITQAYVVYSDGSSIVSGLTNGEIITLTEDWYLPVHSCRLTLRHAPLQYSNIKAYCAFRNKPSIVTSEQLGVGTGGRKTFQLSHIQGIKYDTFRLYYDNQIQYVDYELNCEVGRVTCEAPEGVIVSCGYEYGWGVETWEPMTLSQRYSLMDYDVSEYRISHESDNMSVVAIRIALEMTSGHINNEVLGTGTGRAKTYKLSRKSYDGHVSITVNNAGLNSRYWTILDDPQYISIAASSGGVIRASYDWISETAEIYQLAAVFAE